MKFEPGKKRYNDYPTFFKTLFQERVQKLSIDGGFTCPNRDGSKGVGGCSFCNNESFNPDYCRAVRGITEQIEEGIRFFARKYKGQRYLAYFQAYSNTYASLDVLKLRYEEALAHPMISGLVIGTAAGCGERGDFGLSGKVGSTILCLRGIRSGVCE